MSVSELVGGAIGTILFALGVASVIASTLRRRKGDRVLLMFGIWCGLYGFRLFLEQSFIVEAVGIEGATDHYLRAFTTYLINIPIGLFVEALIGQGWLGSVRLVWQLQAAYAAAAIIVDAVTRRPGLSMPVNSPVVLVGMLLGLANLWIDRRRLSPTFKSQAIAAAACVMLFFVINENLRRPVIPSINLEPVGVFVFVMTLGYGVMSSVFRQEAELVAVNRELATARQIQTALLPRHVPKTRGLDVAARYLPMTAVAGDLYDFVELGPSRVGLLVADVAGHGVPAALVASMVKLAFTAQAETADNPAHVLTAINRILCRHVETTFVTAVYAVIDTESRSITIANAGHPPLLIGNSGGPVTESAARGLMLGVMPDAGYDNERLPLSAGDIVLLYTDGVTETQNPVGEFFDSDRVKAWLPGNDGDAAALFADATLAKLRAWRGGMTFDDDVTLMVARCTDRMSVGA